MVKNIKEQEVRQMEKWIESAVGKMHVNKITQGELAKTMGCSREIVCKTLSGKFQMKNGKQRFLQAIDAILSDRKCKNSVSH